MPIIKLVAMKPFLASPSFGKILRVITVALVIFFHFTDPKPIYASDSSVAISSPSSNNNGIANNFISSIKTIWEELFSNRSQNSVSTENTAPNRNDTNASVPMANANNSQATVAANSSSTRPIGSPSYGSVFKQTLQIVENNLAHLSWLPRDFTTWIKQIPHSVAIWKSYLPSELDQLLILEIIVCQILIFISANAASGLVKLAWRRKFFTKMVNWSEILANDHLAGYSQTNLLIRDLVAVHVSLFAGYSMLVLLEKEIIVTETLILLLLASYFLQLGMVLSRIVLSPRVLRQFSLSIRAATVSAILLHLRRILQIFFYGMAISVSMRIHEVSPNFVGFFTRTVVFLLLFIAIRLIYKNRQIDFYIPFVKNNKKDDPHWNNGFSAYIYHAFARLWWLLASVYLIMIYLGWAFQFQGGPEVILKRTGFTLIILLLLQLVLNLLLRVMVHTVWVRPKLAARLPSLVGRLQLYESFSKTVVFLISLVGALLIIANIWGFNSFGWMSTAQWHRWTKSGLTIALTLVVAVIVWELLGAMIEQALMPSPRSTKSNTQGGENSEASIEKQDATSNQKQVQDEIEPGKNQQPASRLNTLLPLLRNLLLIFLLSLVVITILAQFGVNVGPLIAGAGFIGLGLGFGAQALVKDLITGLFIVIEDIFKIGDIVEIGGKMGIVESLTVRTVRIRDGEGTLFTIPFGTVTTIANLTRDYSMHKSLVIIGWSANIDQVCELIHQVDRELRQKKEIKNYIVEPIEIGGIETMTDNSISVIVTQKTLVGKQFDVKRQFNLMLLKKFQDYGIDSPGPRIRMESLSRKLPNRVTSKVTAAKKPVVALLKSGSLVKSPSPAGVKTRKKNG